MKCNRVVQIVVGLKNINSTYWKSPGSNVKRKMYLSHSDFHKISFLKKNQIWVTYACSMNVYIKTQKPNHCTGSNSVLRSMYCMYTCELLSFSSVFPHPNCPEKQQQKKKKHLMRHPSSCQSLHELWITTRSWLVGNCFYMRKPDSEWFKQEEWPHTMQWNV